jgi:hypothetical protein
MAQPGVRIADQHLSVPGLVQLEFLDLDALAWLVDNGGLSLHGASSMIATMSQWQSALVLGVQELDIWPLSR